jgi:hypothetical protein
MRLPSGLNATLETESVWPVSGSPIGLPVSVSHSCAVLSDAVTMRLLSGLNAALETASVWPVSGSPIGLPVPASYSRAVLSNAWWWAITLRDALGSLTMAGTRVPRDGPTRGVSAGWLLAGKRVTGHERAIASNATLTR